MALTVVDQGLLDTNAQYTGFKNRLINGSMTIDQRNAGASVTVTGNIQAIDRWQSYASVTSKYSFQQNAGSVTPAVGFGNYLGITSLSAYSVAAGDYFYLRQAIEGFNTSDLAWGTASAKTVTLSFQVYSSLTGTFGGALSNSASSRSYPFSYSVPTANTWTTVFITVAGDTTGTWIGATNGVGLQVLFSLGTGTTYSGTAGAWAGSTYVSATGATSVVGTSGATFYITGVQLEKGSTATSFDYRPYGTEFALCQRYYEVCSATYLQAGLGTGGSNIVAGQYRVTKRTTPTLTLTQTNGSGGGTFSNTVDNWSASAVPDANGRIGWSATSSAEL